MVVAQLMVAGNMSSSNPKSVAESVCCCERL
jgi:hypothetical protein